MNPWKLKGYLTNQGENVVSEWCRSVEDDEWLAFAFNMDYLCGQPANRWGRPWAEKLHGECKGLVEIIFEVRNIQHRPLGYYSGEMEFTLLFFATEVNNRFEPITACEIANRRRSDIETGRRRASVFRIEENIKDEDSKE